MVWLPSLHRHYRLPQEVVPFHTQNNRVPNSTAFGLSVKGKVCFRILPLCHYPHLKSADRTISKKIKADSHEDHSPCSKLRLCTNFDLIGFRVKKKINNFMKNLCLGFILWSNYRLDSVVTLTHDRPFLSGLSFWLSLHRMWCYDLLPSTAFSPCVSLSIQRKLSQYKNPGCTYCVPVFNRCITWLCNVHVFFFQCLIKIRWLSP